MFPNTYSRELWRQEAALEQTISTAREELSKAERNLKSTASRVSTLLYSIILDSFIPLSIKILCSNCIHIKKDQYFGVRISIFLIFMFQGISNGIETVKRIMQEKNLEGVYGPLIENFTVEEKYFTAVEVTAGNK